MGSRATLYQRVVQVTTEYLGPAAPRFIDRQIQNHLQKKPNELTVQDLPVLIDWSKVALALLTDDHQVVLNYVEDLNSLYRDAR
jgi:hypothetical protein